ncbi:hypothetical protein [Aurantiacibacter odishensis]|uniref:hypothetical protein n=1 Tax=Aurantiacibacter odishensis TaxID=1155476 RepID=UPI000E7542EF|nr:hypothetical protein [Aurantiacibacter odishensis]
MSARWFLAAAALLAAPALAQDSEMPDAALLADRFEYALVAGDYRVLDLTEDFTYIENGAQLDPWDGMWRTTTAVEGVSPAAFAGAFTLDYRVGIDGPDEVVRVVEYEENGVRGVMAYRLLAREGKIARIDVLPIREEFGGDRGGTITLLQPMLPFTMGGGNVGPAVHFVAGAANVDAALMAESMTNYLEAMAADAPQLRHELLARFAFSESCVREDNGQRATGVADSAILDPSQPSFSPYALGCREQVLSGFYSNYELANLQLHLDPERATGIAFVRLDQPGTKLSFTTPEGIEIAYPGPRGVAQDADPSEQFDGRVLDNMITPMSVNGVFLFAFDRSGAIAHIDAFYRGAPLGWDAVPD